MDILGGMPTTGRKRSRHLLNLGDSFTISGAPGLPDLQAASVSGLEIVYATLDTGKYSFQGVMVVLPLDVATQYGALQACLHN